MLNHRLEIELIRILSNTGQLVLDADVNAEFYQIDVSQFESGIYYIKLETKEGSLVKKIVIE